jgi:large subunit ribosomal protein L3
MKAMLAKKIGMTRLFQENGTAVPVTLLHTGPNVVVQIKTKANDGYDALQVGLGSRRAKNVSKSVLGHLEKAKLKPFARLGEIAVENLEGVAVGQEIKPDVFKVGEIVDVIGTSKGLGFQGTVRRHGFAGGPKTHGQSDRMRAPGSVGASSYPSRTFKGQRMAGRMGGDRVTVKNVKVALVDVENSVIGVMGAVPGKNNSWVKIRKK